MIQDAPALNVSGGLYQVGLSLSKFQIGVNVTELSTFRPGFFELQLQEIGVYSSSTSTQSDTGALLLETGPVQTLTKEQAKKKRPVLLKVLSPITSLLFSEKG